MFYKGLLLWCTRYGPWALSIYSYFFFFFSCGGKKPTAEVRKLNTTFSRFLYRWGSSYCWMPLCWLGDVEVRKRPSFCCLSLSTRPSRIGCWEAGCGGEGYSNCFLIPEPLSSDCKYGAVFLTLTQQQPLNSYSSNSSVILQTHNSLN